MSKNSYLMIFYEIDICQVMILGILVFVTNMRWKKVVMEQWKIVSVIASAQIILLPTVDVYVSENHRCNSIVYCYKFVIFSHFFILKCNKQHVYYWLSCFPVKVTLEDCIDKIYALKIILTWLSQFGEIFYEFGKKMHHYPTSCFKAEESFL